MNIKKIYKLIKLKMDKSYETHLYYKNAIISGDKDGLYVPYEKAYYIYLRVNVPIHKRYDGPLTELDLLMKVYFIAFASPFLLKEAKYGMSVKEKWLNKLGLIKSYHHYFYLAKKDIKGNIYGKLSYKPMIQNYKKVEI